jgi:hypothetical protein
VAIALHQDRVFSSPVDRVADFAFDEAVASVFDDMVSRSVPSYAEIQRMLVELATYFATPNSNRPRRGGVIQDSPPPGAAPPAALTLLALCVLYRPPLGGGPANAREFYAVAADGQRFLIHSSASSEFRAPITVMVNWAGTTAETRIDNPVRLSRLRD